MRRLRLTCITIFSCIALSTARLAGSCSGNVSIGSQARLQSTRGKRTPVGDTVTVIEVIEASPSLIKRSDQNFVIDHTNELTAGLRTQRVDPSSRSKHILLSHWSFSVQKESGTAKQNGVEAAPLTEVRRARKIR